MRNKRDHGGFHGTQTLSPLHTKRSSSAEPVIIHAHACTRALVMTLNAQLRSLVQSRFQYRNMRVRRSGGRAPRTLARTNHETQTLLAHPRTKCLEKKRESQGRTTYSACLVSFSFRCPPHLPRHQSALPRPGESPPQLVILMNHPPLCSLV